MRPDVPLKNLDAQAEAAIRALEAGAASVNVIDERHRVDRGVQMSDNHGRERSLGC